ncbi:hypothetical protein FQN50_000424 [Emmonsiellopsis sp. PD_5]|nr:hypothetical protein FQN50_000424 [Emmonsiellopsis sp. PD_5]
MGGFKKRPTQRESLGQRNTHPPRDTVNAANGREKNPTRTQLVQKHHKNTRSKTRQPAKGDETKEKKQKR